MIKCEYNGQECESCKYFKKCDLHLPCSISLYSIKRELKWYITQFKIIEKGISHWITVIYLYEHNKLPPIVNSKFDLSTAKNKLQTLRNEKIDTINQIQSLRTREKNITKILKRRKKNEV